MKYRLLAIDLDGTLFDSSGRVSAGNIEAVRRAEEAGLIVALCTGRGFVESRAAVIALEHRSPMVLATGAHIADPVSGQTLHRQSIEAELAMDAVRHLNNDRDAVLILVDPHETGYDYLVVGERRLTPNTRWWFDVMNARVRYIDEPTHHDLSHALRVGVVGPVSHMPPILDGLSRHFAGRLHAHHFMAVRQVGGEDVHVMEIFADGVNKWTGLQWLARQHGIEPGQVAAIGDEVNDVAMIRSAGCGIAMANAVPALRDIARHVTLSNDQDGVAIAIDRLLCGDW